MKQYFIYGFFAFLVGSHLFAQTSMVPQSVMGAFRQKFNEAESVEWKKPAGTFGVSFVFNGHYYNAKFSTDGRLIEIRRNLYRFELPILLQDSLERYLGKSWITSVSSVERPMRPL